MSEHAITAIAFAVLTVALFGIAAVSERHNTRRELAPMASLAVLMSFVAFTVSMLCLAGVFG